MMDIFKKPYAYAGLLVVGVVGWALVVAGGAIVNGHPTYWVAYGAAAVGGGVALIAAVAWRSRRTRVWLALLVSLGLVLVAGAAWWLMPFEATTRAVEAMESDSAVRVDTSTSVITMTPAGTSSTTGLIFQPGARVDARAYAHILRPIAEAGHPVVIVKQPFGLAFLASGFAPTWAAEHTDVRWVVAGHSLGGVVAAENAAEPNALGDLVLWASFPASDVSRETFEAVSVFGTHDTLTTTDRIEESISQLPGSTEFVAVEGAIHSHFGDYGLQPGDGDPGIPHDVAQAAIISATLAFLAGDEPSG